MLLFDSCSEDDNSFSWFSLYASHLSYSKSILSSSSKDNTSFSLLIKYNELYQQGILTEEEFTALKKKLLGL